MKIQSLISMAALFLVGSASAQTVYTDTVVMGPGYANEVFYNVATGVKTKSIMNKWHIAHTSNTRDNCIKANHANGSQAFVKVFAYPKGDNSAYASFDTTGWSTWKSFTNDVHKHELGAFNQSVNSANPWDFSWGTYNSGTHIITGDSLFMVVVNNGTSTDYIKFMPIAQYPNGDFTFRYDIVGGTKSSTVIDTLKQSDANGGAYKYFNFTTKSLSVEPNGGDWDLNFTRYYESTFNGSTYVPYGVMGVQSKRGTLVSKIENTLWDDLKANGQLFIDSSRDTTGGNGFQNDLSRIGSKWKTFNGQSYDMVADLNYIIEKKVGSSFEYWAIQFTGFVGSSAGRIILNRTKLGAVTSVNNLSNNVSIFPIPATNNIYVKPLTGAKIQTITLRSMDGRLIRSANSNNFNVSDAAQLSIADMSAGQYIIEVQTSMGSHSQIITKN